MTAADIDPAVVAAVWPDGRLTLPAVQRAAELLTCRDVDFGDLFFARETGESFFLEEGLVKGGAFGISLGVGVRAVSGGKTGFAYSEELTPAALEGACRAARSIRAGHNCPGVAIRLTPRPAPSRYAPDDPLPCPDRAAKAAILERLDRLARATDPRVCQVMGSLSCTHVVRLILTTSGTLVWDRKPMVHLGVSVVLERHGRREKGHAAAGGAFMFGELEPRLEALAREAVRIGQVNMEATPAPAGTMCVVLGPGWPGVLIHEAVGHGLEGDFIRTGSSAFTGRLHEQVASPACTVVDDGTLPDRRGSLTYDDEGTPTRRNVLIERGRLTGFMQDRLNAGLMQAALTGNGRREGYHCLPLPRMTNTFLLPGAYAPEEIIGSVERGLYAVNFDGGQVDISSGKFVFSTAEAYLIEHGRVTRPVKGATLIGTGAETMQQVSMVGSDLRYDDGIGMCGKAGQSVPVGIGQPTVKIAAITVGGQEVTTPA